MDPASILERYLRAVFSRKLKTEDCEILRELAQERATPIDKDLIPWFQEEPVELATFLYCFDILKRYQVVNPFIQLNGLGILDFDTSKLRNKIDEVLSHIAASQDLLANIFQVTERTITEGQIARLIRILPLLKLEDLARAILQEKSPLLVFGLINCFLQQAIDEKSLNNNCLQWAAELPHHSLFQEKVLETDFTQAARQALTFLCELSYIESRLQKGFQRQNEIAPLLDWYKSSGSYRLELAHARARSALRVMEPEELREELKKYLKEVRERIHGFLEDVDLNLSDLIKKDQKGFFTHPRLSTNVLRDLVLRASREPSDKTRLWILIFDGMRLDTWEEVVKKALSSLLEVSEEKLYLCPLPSYTDIARTSLLAGRLPSEWEDYQGKYTSDHNILASRLFGLGREEGKRKLRIVVGSETDYGQERLDFDVRSHNILIYNLSDDWIHNFRGDIKDLNDDIDGRLRRTILPDLESRIAEDDFVILTSDHGFIELLKNKEVKIPVSENLKEDEIVYRYLKGGKYEIGLTVQWIGDEPYTVATGRSWYGRPKGKFSRYSHGGVSLDEMVVPGVVLKKVTKPIIDFEMSLPEEFEFLEDSPAVIEIEVLNRGNRESAFTLAVETEVGQGKTFERRLTPKLRDRLDFHFTPELAMKSIRFVLSYKDAEGIEKQDSRRIGVQITPKKGKIEIDTSALDRLDQI
ncbi:MAG: hypothetical protein DDT19_02113 [Syntrophomonadaceae bacterium]|nr:hypothetical protein [Bacillota bacterium]